MGDKIDFAAAAALLSARDQIQIIMHKNPDGDTMGCGFALCAALRALGKQANAVCDSALPSRYKYMTDPLPTQEFAPAFFVAVDTADRGRLGAAYQDQTINICIDHHGSNSDFAQHLLCDPNAASCAELVGGVIEALGVTLNTHMADCLYTGVSTDTGCFCYANTTPESLRFAARLIEAGADHIGINNLLFQTKSRGRMELECLAIAGMKIASGGRVAFMTITQEMLRHTGVEAADIERIAALPRTIEGVEVGVTVREAKDGSYRISLRTATLDAAAICGVFGGGGHVRAGGFECTGTPEDIQSALLSEIERRLA